MHKIKKGDHVIVTSGRDKGKNGKVLRVLEGGKKLLIEGINLVKKHVKPNPQKNQRGGIVEKEAAIDASNAALLNPMSKKADKVGIRVLEDGRRVRYFKSNNELVDMQ